MGCQGVVVLNLEKKTGRIWYNFEKLKEKKKGFEDP